MEEDGVVMVRFTQVCANLGDLNWAFLFIGI